MCDPFEMKLTDILPTEAAGSARPVGVQVSVSEVALLVDPQATLVIIHYVLPVLTLKSQRNHTTVHIYIV